MPEETERINDIKIWSKIISNAKNNTLIYRRVFGCYPDDNITVAQEIDEHVFESKPDEYFELMPRIVAHAVEMPLNFMKDECLELVRGDKEGLFGEKTFLWSNDYFIEIIRIREYVWWKKHSRVLFIIFIIDKMAKYKHQREDYHQSYKKKYIKKYDSYKENSNHSKATYMNKNRSYRKYYDSKTPSRSYRKSYDSRSPSSSSSPSYSSKSSSSDSFHKNSSPSKSSFSSVSSAAQRHRVEHYSF